MKKALLIIDLQKGFDPTDEMVSGFLEKAKQYEVIVATKFVNGNSLYQTVLDYPEVNTEEGELAPLPEGTKIFEKTGYGLPTELLQYLKENSVTNVDIGGLETDACVLAAMYDLWDAEIQPTLLKDLATTPDSELQKAAHLIAKRNFSS